MDTATLLHVFKITHRAQWKKLLLLNIATYDDRDLKDWKDTLLLYGHNIYYNYSMMSKFGLQLYLQEKKLELSPAKLKRFRNDALYAAMHFYSFGRLKILFNQLEITKNSLGSQLIQVFKYGAEYNNLEVLRWITERLQVQKSDISDESSQVLQAAARTQDSCRTFRWIVDTFEFTTDDIFQNLRTVQRLCQDQPTIQWLINRFDWTKSDVLIGRPHLGYIGFLHFAAECCQFKLLKFLIKRLGFGRSDIIRNRARVFWRAATHGHLGIARWLTNRFDLEKHELEITKIDILLMVNNKHWETLKWLVGQFGYTRIDFHESFMVILHTAIMDDNMSALYWIIDQFEIPKDEILNSIQCIFLLAMQEKKLRTLKMITREFAITRADIIQTFGAELILQMRNFYHSSVIRWFTKQFSLHGI